MSHNAKNVIHHFKEGVLKAENYKKYLTHTSQPSYPDVWECNHGCTVWTGGSWEHSHGVLLCFPEVWLPIELSGVQLQTVMKVQSSSMFCYIWFELPVYSVQSYPSHYPCNIIIFLRLKLKYRGVILSTLCSTSWQHNYTNDVDRTIVLDCITLYK